MLKKKETLIDGQYLLSGNLFADNRGEFLKIFNKDVFMDNSLHYDFKEFYYSKSQKGVLRGMHFQIPPFQHEKLVYVSFGSIMDVTVDLRRSSSSFGKLFSCRLDAQHGEFLYIPAGVAHGFLSLEDNSIVNYAQTSCYSKEHDKGVHYLSVPFDWGEVNPVVSDRDTNFPYLDEFMPENPFL